MKKTFLFLAALAMSVVSMAASATYTKVTSNPTDWSGDYILVYETDGAARVFTGVDAVSDFVEATISDNTITGEFVTLTLETTDGGYLVKINGGDNDGKYISSSANSNGLNFGDNGAVMTMSYDESVFMTNAGGAVMRYNSASNQNRFRFYKSSSYTSQQPVQLYKAGSTPTPVTLEGIVIKGTASKLEYFVGDSFDPAGLEVWGIYTKTVKGDSTSQITKGITWTCDPEVFALGNTSVDVTATYKDKTSAPFTVNNIVVKEKVVPTGYAGTYTSNVELTTEGGTSAYAAKVIIGGTTYDAIKCGTSSIAGACVITIPAATKTLHFHAAGWNKESVVLNESINLVADAGVSGNSPFTLQNDPATQDYFTLDPKGATTITFTATSGKRFVLFGVNAELAEGVVAAPTFTPTESEFDKEVTVTLTADEGADIYYTLDGTTPSNASTKYEAPFKLTATTTVKAIAIKGDKSSEVAEKTYTLIPSFESLEDLVTKQPATETNVTVIVTITEASVDSFYVTSKGQKNGIYTHVGETVVELYLYDVPETWVVGGKVSGKIQAQWGLYKGTAELQQWEGGWNAFSYTAPGPITNLQELMQDNIVRKVLVNGHLVIIKDNQLFNLQGQAL